MKWLIKLGISLAIALFAVCCGAVLLFNWGGFGYKALTVPTGSMRPNIPPGSVVLMHRVPYSTLRVGDVITYTNPSKPSSTITHRIVKTYKLDGRIPAYITKGDTNPTPDQPVVGGQVLGKTVWHASHIGAWLGWSKTWVGIAILVYLPAAVIMWGSALDMADHMRKFQLYELKLFPKTRHRFRFKPGRRTGAATLLVTLFVLILGTVAGPVQALLRSNTVTLGPNRLTVASTSHCTNTTNNNNTTINNTNNQTATSGNTTNSDNTTGGNATSGNASNSNSTTITVTNTNCH